MKEYNEEDFLQLSGIQHFKFCRRQWALIHIEQQWNDNLLTMEGNILHDTVHDEFLKEKRGDLIISRGMPVFSRTLGINGSCDAVEFRKNASGVSITGFADRYIPTPIEYKRGRPKSDDADILQLTAQAMCLEEMLLCEIETGYLYYGETKHRLKVELNDDYRNMVKDICRQMHELYEKCHTPKVKTSNACKSCSVKDICLPRLCKNTSVKDYIERSIDGQ